MSLLWADHSPAQGHKPPWEIALLPHWSRQKQQDLRITPLRLFSGCQAGVSSFCLAVCKQHGDLREQGTPQVPSQSPGQGWLYLHHPPPCWLPVLWPWYDFISLSAHTHALEAALPRAQRCCSQGKCLPYYMCSLWKRTISYAKREQRTHQAPSVRVVMKKDLSNTSKWISTLLCLGALFKGVSESWGWYFSRVLLGNSGYVI